MRITTLGYHDVVDNVISDAGARKAAGHYALTRSAFREHLGAIKSANVEVSVVRKAVTYHPPGLLLTFDDGAIGGYECAAGELERLGWRGHFFITTDWISRPGFMEPHHLRELYKGGHVIGSHTCSHPARMSRLSREQLLFEWKRSREILEDILGAKVDVASVSDGYYSKRVGLTASESGLKYLFNSEPTDATSLVAGCRILGRFPIFATSSPTTARSFASGARLPRWKQAVAWNTKKILKTVGGQTYLNVRQAILSRPSSQ